MSYGEDVRFLVGVIRRTQRELDEWEAKRDPNGQKAKQTVLGIQKLLEDNGYGFRGPVAGNE